MSQMKQTTLILCGALVASLAIPAPAQQTDLLPQVEPQFATPPQNSPFSPFGQPPSAASSPVTDSPSTTSPFEEPPVAAPPVAAPPVAAPRYAAPAPPVASTQPIASSPQFNSPPAAAAPPSAQFNDAPSWPQPTAPHRDVPSLVPSLAPSSSPVPSPSQNPRSADEHLQQAIEHLRAAGKSDLADRLVTEVARRKREALIETKLKQVQQLQEEIAELRKADAVARRDKPEQQVLIHVQMMELQVEKMRELGISFDAAGVVTPPLQLKLLETLRKQGLVKVIAEPTLVTMNGRPASFHSGGEFPVPMPQKDQLTNVEYRSFGTRLDVLPEIQPNGKIRLELRPTVTELDTKNSVKIGDQTVPSLRCRSLNTAVEVAAGETVVIGGPTQHSAQASSAVALLLTARVESVSASR